ncbi:dual specificity protein phosphatase family protein [uncultured Hymenobacter sp.]|uniref:dual specificity protein phosphatase family protein n=1 Tax=uncultured Hymenobacter sp. TaxID=170016 RepID=UPI0035CB0C2A
MKFEDWFRTRLHVQRYPMPTEISKATGALHVVNVSDMYIHSCAQAARDSESAVFYHWFPMNECTGHIGLNSLYGALQILHMAEKEGHRVLLHCAAGANRSPTVAQAYYFMRTGRHWRDHEEPNSERQATNEWLSLPKTMRSQNRLLGNIEEGLLPAKAPLEKFLKLCGTKFEEMEQWDRSGLLTQLKLDTGLL